MLDNELPRKEIISTDDRRTDGRTDGQTSHTTTIGCFFEKKKTTKSCATMPSSYDDSVLAELFSNFFAEKNSKLRVNFTFDSSSDLDIAPLTDGKFDCLRLATSKEIQSTILSASNSSCALDPIPTWLLKQCIRELLPIITAILNTSLKTGSVPALFNKMHARRCA